MISDVIKLIFLKIKGRNRKSYKRKVESKDQKTLFDFIEQACKKTRGMHVITKNRDSSQKFSFICLF